MYDRKVCEALEINELRTLNEKDGTFKVINRDNSDYVIPKIGNHYS